MNGEPVFQQDIIATQNRIDLKVHQFTAVGTFGVTDRFDVSVAIPILDVRMAVSSNATINSFEAATDIPPCCVHRFDSANADSQENFIDRAHANFFNNNTYSGIGDVIFRGEFQALKGEKAGLAVGLDVHLPTGDERNFLGSGTWGLRPFATFSYVGRISPHASSVIRGTATRCWRETSPITPAPICPTSLPIPHLSRRRRCGGHASRHTFCELPGSVPDQR